MKIAIMQPYFFPYIGYFQLMNAVDEFVVYDNIEYTKKGWINRNRILVNGKDEFISLSLKKDSDFLSIKERTLSGNWPELRFKMKNRIVESYRHSPNFEEVFPVIEKCLNYENYNLFEFIFFSLNEIRKYLNIQTTLIISSSIPIDHQLKAESKVIAMCKERKAEYYINPIGGILLYSNKAFTSNKIKLRFIKSGELKYKQYVNEFIPWLSIVDVLMFVDKQALMAYLNEGYELIEN
jgi:hypothetical protein